MNLIGLELRRIIGRKGSFFGVMAVAFAIALLVLFLVDGDDQTEDVWTNAIGTPLVFGATVVGALAGSYDIAQGTMRYLVLTGVPRWKLVAIRVPALLVTIFLIALPAMVVGAIAMGTGSAADGTELIRALAAGFTFAAIWGIVAMAVGTLLRSNGAGIAVALVLFLVGSGITFFVQAQVSETVGDYLLPNLVSMFALFGHEPTDAGSDFPDMSYPVVAIALAIWMAAVVGLAIARAERDEY